VVIDRIAIILDLLSSSCTDNIPFLLSIVKVLYIYGIDFLDTVIFDRLGSRS